MERGNKESRKEVINEVIRRTNYHKQQDGTQVVNQTHTQKKSGDISSKSMQGSKHDVESWPQTIIYPEGSLTNFSTTMRI